MGSGFRASMNGLHTWAGVTVGALLFSIFWMGTLAVFDAEIDRWMIPETRLAATTEPLSVDRLWHQEPPPPGSGVWSVRLPTDRNPTAEVRLRGPDGRWRARTIDPATGRTLPPAGSLAGTGFVYPFHVHLHLRSFEIGYWIVGFCGMAMLLLIVSGVAVHRRIFADFFLFRTERKATRGVLDLHNVTGVLALPFHVMIALSGLVIFLSIYYPGVRAVLYAGDDRAYYAEAFGTNSYARPRQGRPAGTASLDAIVASARAAWGGDAASTVTVHHPHDAAGYVRVGRSTEAMVPYNRDHISFDAVDGSMLARYERTGASAVQRFVAGLHFLQFRHWTLRWLYFALGLSGCVMIATGYVFWLGARRKRLASDGAIGFRVVAALTVGAVCGIVLGTLAFLVANRLLPPGARALGQDRAALEVWSFFLAWTASLAHAWLRPDRAWLEQCRATAALAVAAALLNWVTTGDHLARTLGHRHLWPIAGMDLVLLAGAATAMLAARSLARRRPAP